MAIRFSRMLDPSSRREFLSGIHPRLTLADIQFVHLGAWHGDSMAAPFWRAYWNSEPGASITYKGCSYDLTPEKVFLIPPETDFAYFLSNPVHHLFIHFSLQQAEEVALPGILSFPRDKFDTFLTQQLQHLGRDPGLTLTSFVTQSWVFYLLSRIPQDNWVNTCRDHRLRRVIHTCSSDMKRKWVNTEMAEISGLAENAFIRLFSRELGQSPQQWLCHRRLEHACWLLHDSSLSIPTVAIECGFADRYHFSRAFKKLRGKGPASFRKHILQTKIHSMAGDST